MTVTVAGGTVEATGNHPFWVAAGDGLAGRPAAEHVPAGEQAPAPGGGRWVDARHLRAGDVLVLRDRGPAAIEAVAARLAAVPVYNLRVDGIHSYAVGNAGIAVHNRDPGGPGLGSGRPPSGNQPIQVTDAAIQAALKDSPMQSTQGAVSRPVVERYVRMLEAGQEPPPISVDGNIVVDGNHRYIAGRLVGKEPPQVPGNVSPSQRPKARPISEVTIDPTDWGMR